MRIKKLQQAMKSKNIELSLFLCFTEEPNTNMIYFADYSGKGILAVTKKSAFILCPEYEKGKLPKNKIKKIKVEKTRLLFDELKEVLKNKNINKTAVEDDKITVYMYKKIKKQLKGRYTDISTTCSKIRMVKEEKEISKIKKACKITDNIYSKIIKNFRFKTEDEIRSFIKTEAKKNNCDMAFPPIAASAEGSSEVHYKGSKKIKKGFLMLDFGVKYKGYCSDMSRMLYVGKPKKSEIEDFDLVLKTINKCEKSKVKKFSELHVKANKILGKKAEFFTHFLGHGVGIDIHESPAVYEEDKNKVKENIVFTIEPGIYFPEKYGIRIEDTVIIKDKKIKTLTKSKKELVIIK